MTKTQFNTMLIEAKVWGLAWAIAGLIAGAGLGALLSGGEYLPWTTLGGLVGLVSAGITGAFLGIFWEIIWGLGVWLTQKINPDR